VGHEVACKVRIDGKMHDARALLETDEIIIRADRRVVVPVRNVKSVDASGDELHVRWETHEASFAIGEANARKWAERIRNPKSRIDKLGVKPGQRISVIGVDDREIIAELTARGADVSSRARELTVAIFFGANDNKDLARISALKSSLAPAGAIWVIRPKGQKAITEIATMSAGRAAGLVDVKVVKFSDTHTAEKFVIPVTRR
jgi:hypothetical protein